MGRSRAVKCRRLCRPSHPSRNCSRGGTNGRRCSSLRYSVRRWTSFEREPSGAFRAIPRSTPTWNSSATILTSAASIFGKQAAMSTYLQIHWAAGRGAVRDGNDRTHRRQRELQHFLLRLDDLYDSQGEKQIAPRFSHLPKPQTLALIQGLLETDGNVSRGKEITLPTHPSLLLKAFATNSCVLEFRLRANSPSSKQPYRKTL